MRDDVLKSGLANLSKKGFVWRIHLKMDVMESQFDEEYR